jgi:hypothetical protein
LLRQLAFGPESVRAHEPLSVEQGIQVVKIARNCLSRLAFQYKVLNEVQRWSSREDLKDISIRFFSEDISIYSNLFASPDAWIRPWYDRGIPEAHSLLGALLFVKKQAQDIVQRMSEDDLTEQDLENVIANSKEALHLWNRWHHYIGHCGKLEDRYFARIIFVVHGLMSKEKVSIGEGVFNVDDWWHLEQMSLPSGLKKHRNRLCKLVKVMEQSLQHLKAGEPNIMVPPVADFLQGEMDKGAVALVEKVGLCCGAILVASISIALIAPYLFPWIQNEKSGI